MANISHRLMIKYGLRGGPSQALADQWLALVDALVRQGVDSEAAGHQAARQLFPDYNTHFYASEADTITSLLRIARDKD